MNRGSAHYDIPLDRGDGLLTQKFQKIHDIRLKIVIIAVLDPKALRQKKYHKNVILWKMAISITT